MCLMQQICEERYIMSQEELDALLGKTLREHKQMSRRLEMLRARAAEIGSDLVRTRERA